MTLGGLKNIVDIVVEDCGGMDKANTIPIQDNSCGFPWKHIENIEISINEYLDHEYVTININ